MLEFETSFYLSDNGDRLVDERGPIEISSTSLSKELFLKLLLRNLELNFRGKFCEEILDEFINILYDILALEFCESIIPSSSFFFFFPSRHGRISSQRFSGCGEKFRLAEEEYLNLSNLFVFFERNVFRE